ncbi:MAG TPA: hypothetical protein PLM08_17720, partial [Polyangiaceae bacterium]|nr:hypothetical protein [Polyangiaceae bacterium]
QKDALWNQAMQSEDDIDLASLADREGASGLLDALEVGGKVGQTALAALPMADDAPVAFRRLSQLVLLTQGSAQQRVMQTIFSIAETPIHRGEPIDDGGAELCAMALTRLVQDSKTPAPLRSLAISTLRLPAFVVFVDASTNPMTPGAPPGSASVDGP